jgi:hypothetical protein
MCGLQDILLNERKHGIIYMCAMLPLCVCVCVTQVPMLVCALNIALILHKELFSMDTAFE